MNNELKTSEQWQKLHPESYVLDADGWDRSNYQYSWHEELITFEEYQRRLGWSTVLVRTN